MSKTGQIVRLLTGLGLAAWAIAGGPIWTWVGVPIIATGAWRWCPILMMLRARPDID